MKEVIAKQEAITTGGTSVGLVPFYYYATTVLLIELALTLWITGIIRPLGTGWPF